MKIWPEPLTSTVVKNHSEQWCCFSRLCCKQLIDIESYGWSIYRCSLATVVPSLVQTPKGRAWAKDQYNHNGPMYTTVISIPIRIPHGLHLWGLENCFSYTAYPLMHASDMMPKIADIVDCCSRPGMSKLVYNS